MAGTARVNDTTAEIISPWEGAVAGAHSVPTAADVEEAVSGAVAATVPARDLPAVARAAALDVVARSLSERSEEFARLITAESGKPIRWSRVEVARATSTFSWAAQEARRWSGDLQRLDTDSGADGRLGLVRRFPHGPVLAITPFNFPLNLVAHKVAPAIAVGAPVIVKPSPEAPLTALALGDVMSGADLPAGSWSVLPVGDEAAGQLATDPRLPVLSFTGSDRVGRALQRAAPAKQVVLELGGNAAAAILADWDRPGDLDFAADRIARFGTYQAGQSCISVQRVLVAESLLDDLLPRLVAAVEGLVTGSPWDEETHVGPMISERAARRVAKWIQQARDAGANACTRVGRDRGTVAPTVLTGVPPGSRVWREEVFGPVVAVQPVPDDPQAAFAAINDSRYGLQAGVFTHDLAVAFAAHRELDVGGVVIGDVPSVRSDQMPYGGQKDSGVGREGLVAAMTDYTHSRVLVLNGLPL